MVALPTACSGAMVWATKVAVCSMNRIIDGGAETFVEDLDAEQFGRDGGAVLVGSRDGDVEGQDLVTEPGQSGLLLFLSAASVNGLDRANSYGIYVYT